MISRKMISSSGISLIKKELLNTDSENVIGRYLANQEGKTPNPFPVFKCAKDVIVYGVTHMGSLSFSQLNQLVHTLVSKYAEDIPDTLNDKEFSTDQKKNWTYQILCHGWDDLTQHHWHVFQSLFKSIDNFNNIFDIVSDGFLHKVPNDDVLSLILGATDMTVLISFILKIRPNTMLSVRIIEKNPDIFYAQCDQLIHSDNAPTILKSRSGQFLLEENPDLFFKKMDTITDINHIVSFMLHPIGPHFIIEKNYEWFKNKMVTLVNDPLFMDALKHKPEVFRCILPDDFLFLIELRDDLDDDIRFINDWISFNSGPLISRLNADHHSFLKALPMFKDSELILNIINIINKDTAHHQSLSPTLLATCLMNYPPLILCLDIHRIDDLRIQSDLRQITTLIHEITACIGGLHDEGVLGDPFYEHTATMRASNDGDSSQCEAIFTIVTDAMNKNPVNFDLMPIDNDRFLAIMHAIINVILIRNRYPIQSMLSHTPSYHSLYVYEALRVQFLSIYEDKTMLVSGVQRIMSSEYAKAIRNDGHFWSFLKDVPHFFHHVKSYQLEDSDLMDTLRQMDTLIEKIVSTDILSVSDESLCCHIRDTVGVHHFPNLIKSILLIDSIQTIFPTIQSLQSISVRYCYLALFFDILRQHWDEHNVTYIMLMSNIGVELVNKNPAFFNRALYIIQNEYHLVSIFSLDHGGLFVKKCPQYFIDIIKDIKNEQVVANILVHAGEHLDMPNLIACIDYIYTDEGRASFLLSQGGLRLYNQDQAAFFDQLDQIKTDEYLAQVANKFSKNDATFVNKIIDTITHTFKTEAGIRDVLQNEYGQNLILTDFSEFIKIALRLKGDAIIMSVLQTHYNQILFENINAFMTLVSNITSDQGVFDIMNGVVNEFLKSNNYEPIYLFLRYPIFMLFFDESNIGRAGPIGTEVKRTAILHIRTVRALATKVCLNQFSLAISFPISTPLSELSEFGPFATMNELYKQALELSKVDVYASAAAQMVTLICLRSQHFYDHYIQDMMVSVNENMVDELFYFSIVVALLNHPNANPVAVMASEIAIQCATLDPILMMPLIASRQHSSDIADIITQKMGDLLLKGGYGGVFLSFMDLLDNHGLACVFNHPNSHHIFNTHIMLMETLTKHPSWLVYIHDHHLKDASTDDAQAVLYCANALRQLVTRASDSEGVMGHSTINAAHLDQVSRDTVSSFYVELWEYFMIDTNPQNALTALSGQLGRVLLTDHPVKFNHLMNTLSDTLKVSLMNGPLGVDIANTCINQVYELLINGHYDILYSDVRTVLESKYPHKLRYFLSKISNNSVLIGLLTIPGITQFLSTNKLFEFINRMDETQKKTVLSKDLGRDCFNRNTSRFFDVLYNMKNGSYLGGIMNSMVGEDMAHYYLLKKEPLELLWVYNKGLINSSLFSNFGVHLAKQSIRTFCQLANRVIDGRSVVDTGIPFGTEKIKIICVKRFVNRIWPIVINHDEAWAIIRKLLIQHDLVPDFLKENKALVIQSSSRFAQLLKLLRLRVSLDILSNLSQQGVLEASDQFVAIFNNLKKPTCLITFLRYPFPNTWLKQIEAKFLTLFKKLSHPNDIKSALMGGYGRLIIARYPNECFLLLEKIRGSRDSLDILSHNYATPLLGYDYNKFVTFFAYFVTTRTLSSVFSGPCGNRILDQPQENLVNLFKLSPMSVVCMTYEQKKMPAVIQCLSPINQLISDILRDQYSLLTDMNQHTIIKKMTRDQDDATILIQDDESVVGNEDGGTSGIDHGPILIQDDESVVGNKDGGTSGIDHGPVFIQDGDDCLDGTATLYDIQSYVNRLDGSKWAMSHNSMAHIVQTVIGIMLLRFGVSIDRLIPHDEGISYDWMNRNADVFVLEAIRIARDAYGDADSIITTILKSRMGHIVLMHHPSTYVDELGSLGSPTQKVKVLNSKVGLNLLKEHPDKLVNILKDFGVSNTLILLNSDPIGMLMVSEYPVVVYDVVYNMLSRPLSSVSRFKIQLFLPKIKHIEGYHSLYKKWKATSTSSHI